MTKRILFPFLALVLSACSVPSMPTLPSVELPRSPMKPYTLDIQQGVVVEQSMIDKLKPGMTRNQVGLILGTPLLTDVMHADRWDYVFYTRKDNQVGEWRRFSVYFKEDRLETLTGDVTLSRDKPAAPAASEPSSSSTGLPAPLPGGAK